MRRVIYTISSAAIISMVACATSNAAPIAPIPTAAVPNAANVIQVGYYYHGHYYPYRHHAYYRHRGYAQAQGHDPYYGTPFENVAPYSAGRRNPNNPLRGTRFYGVAPY
jgi:hypothetical protein